jgi:hypothetical protein
MSCLLSAVLVAALGFGPAPSCGGFETVLTQRKALLNQGRQRAAGRRWPER